MNHKQTINHFLNFISLVCSIHFFSIFKHFFSFSQIMSRKKSILFSSVITLMVCVVNAVVQSTATGNEIDSAPKKAQMNTGSPLYPKATDTRDLRTLDGLWNFRKSPTDPETGYRAGWFEQDLDKVMYSVPTHIKSLMIS